MVHKVRVWIGDAPIFPYHSSSTLFLGRGRKKAVSWNSTALFCADKDKELRRMVLFVPSSGMHNWYCAKRLM